MQPWQQTGAAKVGVLIGILQVIGLGISRLVGSRSARLWVGPMVAGAAIVLGGWFWGAAPVRDAAAHGERTCARRAVVSTCHRVAKQPM